MIEITIGNSLNDYSKSLMVIDSLTWIIITFTQKRLNLNGDDEVKIELIPGNRKNWIFQNFLEYLRVCNTKSIKFTSQGSF